MENIEEINWVEEKEKRDGSGKSYYYKCFYSKDDYFLTFCYFPSKNKAWVFDEIRDHPSFNFECKSWDEANKLFKQIFNGNTEKK